MDYPHISLDQIKNAFNSPSKRKTLTNDLSEIGQAALRASAGGSFGQEYDKIQAGKAQAAEKRQAVEFKNKQLGLKQMDLVMRQAEMAAKRGDQEAKDFMDGVDMVLKGVDDPVQRAKFVHGVTSRKPNHANLWQTMHDVANEMGIAPKSEENKAPSGYRWNGDRLEAIPGGPADKPSKPGKLMEALDSETGKLVYVDEDVIRSNPQRYNPAPSGMKFESDGKGGFSLVTGDMANSGPEQSATVTDLEGRVIDAVELRTRLKGIREAFNPEYLRLPSKLGFAWSEMKDRMGNSTPTEQAELREFSQFKRRAVENVSRLLNELSGAAVSPQEEARIKGMIPDAGEGIFDGDSPTVFKAKLDDAMEQLEAAIKRYDALKESWLDKPLGDYLDGPGVPGAEGADELNSSPVGTVIDDGTGKWEMTEQGWRRLP